MAFSFYDYFLFSYSSAPTFKNTYYKVVTLMPYYANFKTFFFWSSSANIAGNSVRLERGS